METEPDDHSGATRESEQLPEEGPPGAGEQEQTPREDEGGDAPGRQDRDEPATGHPDESAG